jgi:hypothetical protein
MWLVLFSYVFRFVDVQKDLNTNSYPFPLLQMQFGLFLTHNILTSDDPSTDEETSTTDNILTSDDPSTDEETSTTDNILTSDDPSTDEGDNTTKMYIYVFYKDTTAQDQKFFIFM